MLWGLVGFLCLDAWQLALVYRGEGGGYVEKAFGWFFFCIGICIAKVAGTLALFASLHLMISHE